MALTFCEICQNETEDCVHLRQEKRGREQAKDEIPASRLAQSRKLRSEGTEDEIFAANWYLDIGASAEDIPAEIEYLRNTGYLVGFRKRREEGDRREAKLRGLPVWKVRAENLESARYMFKFLTEPRDPNMIIE
ncbi:MAG TPA: hypothetical protein VEF34_13850 [Syntrophobacteraceae bacterium]|nr:hypothetical protein [Syntrophobacteraceae bacterium]